MDRTADFLADFERHLRDGVAKLPAAVPDDAAIARMLVHARTLYKWNATHNLTSLKSAKDYAEALFIDSWLVTAAYADFGGATLVDVGSGGGFPGLVILAAQPTLPAVFFENVEKKRSFLATAAAAMHFAHATVSREPFPPAQPLPNGRRIFVSRATWAPQEWLGIARGQAQPGDTIIVQASQEPLPEGSDRAIEAALPFSQAKRRVGVYLHR
ncbi:MAG: class I SAM-dependent methyltransferase [Deltaproteobacteria bacterium]|nr:class I SAM-dependent methyltransferase [Deltaproteobacteria bacterium]